MSTGRVIFGGLAVLLLAAGLGPATAAETVKVRCNISAPSGVKSPLTLAAQVYRVERDSFGTYQLKGQPQILYVTLTPGAGQRAAYFETDLELGNQVEYEFKVVALNDEGYERTDGGYFFVSPDAPAAADKRGEYFDETIALRPGEFNQVFLNLRWLEEGSVARSNFMQIVPHQGHSDYLLSLYVNDATKISLLK